MNAARWPRSTPRSPSVVREETRRQEEGLELIASENFVSPAVMEALGSRAHEQVRRGLPGQALLRRLRGGRRGRERSPSTARSSCSARSTRTSSRTPGSQANMAAYMALMKPGDTLLVAGPQLRRPPHARRAVQLLRQALQGRPLRPRPARPRPIDYRAGPRRSRRSTSRRSSSSAPAPTRAPSTSRSSARSPTRSARR